MSLARPCLLALTLLFAVGCGSSQRFLIPAGEQTASLVSVGLNAEVTQIVNSKRKLQVFVQLENTGEAEIRFKRATVTLDYDGQSYEARDLRAWETDVDVAPGLEKDKYWAFHLGQLAEPGTYDLTIAEVFTSDGELLTAVGTDLVLKVTVPAKAD